MAEGHEGQDGTKESRRVSKLLDQQILSLQEMQPGRKWQFP